MISPFTKDNIRPQDKWGSGAFGTSRGDHTHRGVDYMVAANAPVPSPVAGEVTKIGYPYGDDLSFKYVQITTEDDYNYRLLYVKPSVEIGRLVKIGDTVGNAQTLQGRYAGIIDHVHLEVKLNGEYIDFT